MIRKHVEMFNAVSSHYRRQHDTCPVKSIQFTSNVAMTCIGRMQGWRSRGAEGALAPPPPLPTTFSEASGGKTWVGFQRDRESVCVCVREREREREREMARVCMSSFLMHCDVIVTAHPALLLHQNVHLRACKIMKFLNMETLDSRLRTVIQWPPLAHPLFFRSATPGRRYER